MASQVDLKKIKEGASTNDPALLLYMPAYTYTLRKMIRVPVTELVLNVVFIF